MTALGEGRDAWLVGEAGRWAWLVWLPLFFVPWASSPPSLLQAALAAALLPAVALLYLQRGRRKGRRLVASAVATLALAFLSALSGGVWVVAAIYAAAIAGELRPRRSASVLILVLTLAAGAFAMVARGAPFFTASGLLLMLLVGFANVARAALQDANKALAAAQGEVRRIAVAAERERIGRDLHDLLGRTLTVVTLKAELASRLASRDAGAAEREMRQVAEASRAALGEIRAAVAGMSRASLPREVDASRQALSAAAIGCEIDGDPAAVPAGAGAVLAMVLREAVTNVIRHSGAKLCTISIRSEPAAVRLSVSDDGCGARGPAGLGLAGLRARVEAAGGEFTLQASAGTRIVALLPAEAAA